MKKDNINDFIEIINQLSQNELSNLIDYAIELKKEEIKKSKIIGC